MRPTLLAGLLDSVAHNRRREQKDVRLFELATIFGTGARRASRPGPGLARPGVGDALERLRPRRRSLRHDRRRRHAVRRARPRGGVRARRGAVPDARERDDDRGAAARRRRRRRAARHRRPRRDRAGRRRGARPAGARARLRRRARPRSGRSTGRRATTASARKPCRVSRRARATCRSSSTRPCRRPPFVARSDARRRRRWSASRNSIATRGRASPTAAAACRCGSSSARPDRTLTDAEVQAAMDTIVAALQTEHDARLRQ